jgi:hypothetical protein
MRVSRPRAAAHPLRVEKKRPGRGHQPRARTSARTGAANMGQKLEEITSEVVRHGKAVGTVTLGDLARREDPASVLREISAAPLDG